MKNVLLSMALLLCVLPANADDTSETNTEIESQQYDQSLCEQQVTSRCVNKCLSSGETNCVELCEDNAKNECRQAGE